MLANDVEKKMSVTCGRTSMRQFAFFDPDGSCWRTWPAISLWGSERYSETWPKRGTTRNGAAFEHPTWEPHTAASGFSSLLPTPRATRGGSATETVYLLPTPTAQAAKHATDDRGPGTLDDFNLWAVATRLMPTPSAADGLGGHERRGGARGDELLLAGLVKTFPTPTTQPTTGNGHARNLGKEIKMLPTPTARESKGKDAANREGGASLTHLVSTGALTNPLSDAGNDSPDQCPGQLTLEDA
jgi:hypothetical protein